VQSNFVILFWRPSAYWNLWMTNTNCYDKLSPWPLAACWIGN
jgi:hypothetical protein